MPIAAESWSATGGQIREGIRCLRYGSLWGVLLFTYLKCAKHRRKTMKNAKRIIAAVRRLTGKQVDYDDFWM